MSSSPPAAKARRNEKVQSLSRFLVPKVAQFIHTWPASQHSAETRRFLSFLISRMTLYERKEKETKKLWEGGREYMEVISKFAISAYARANVARLLSMSISLYKQKQISQFSYIWHSNYTR